MTHECGHAFQGYVYGSDPIEEHWDITMETAEIHSMSMEFFTEPWMNLFFKEEADTYRQMHLEDAIALFRTDAWWTNSNTLSTVTRI